MTDPKPLTDEELYRLRCWNPIDPSWPPPLPLLRRLLDEHAALKQRVAELEESNSMACEEPPSGCECPGCSYAREARS